MSVPEAHRSGANRAPGRVEYQSHLFAVSEGKWNSVDEGVVRHSSIGRRAARTFRSRFDSS
jgi:hypothetical protein